MGTQCATPPALQCSTEEITMAILDQKKLIAFELNEGAIKMDRYMTAMIPDGGDMADFDDARTFKSRRAFQCPVGYNDQSFEMDCDPMANMIDGHQTAKAGCGNTCVSIPTLVNGRNQKEACEGVCVVDFAQGGSFTGYDDREIAIATPIRCVKELKKYERKRIADIFSQEIDTFKEIGLDSFEYDLFQKSVQESEANTVVRSIQESPYPVLTAGGWSGPSDRPISINFLCRYRQLIVERLQQTEMKSTAEDYLLTVEMTRDAWHRAKLGEYLYRRQTGGIIPGFGDNLTVEATNKDDIFEFTKRAGRSFEVWENKIRVIFNDMPIRGVMKPAGQTPAGKPLYEFVRIYPYKNEANEIGVSYVTNEDYHRNQAECDGVLYDVMELIPHIHSRSFKRYGLLKAVTPAGVKSQGNNFEVKLLQGSDLGDADCPNFFGEKYRYAMRHEYRWRNIYPELSGWIIHKHEIMVGYDLNPTNEITINRCGDSEACAVVEDIDNCNLETCAKEECLEPVVCDDVLSLDPCGNIETAFCGESHILTLDVCRACPSDQPAQVDYCFVDDTAIYGQHYQVVDAEGNMLPETGNIVFDGDQECCKQIFVQIMDALPCTPGAPAGPDNCCVAEPCAPVDACFVVDLQNEVGATLGCAAATVCIKNYSE